MTDTQLLRPTPQQVTRERLEADLKANQAGILSNRQRWRYVGVRAAEHAVGALTIMLIVAVAINALGIVPDLTTIGVIALVIGVSALLLLVFNVRPAFESRVKFTNGILSRSVIAPPLIQPFYCLTVGKTLFYAQADRFDGLQDDELYEAYYIERPARLGGNVLLTLREVNPSAADAPEDDLAGEVDSQAAINAEINNKAERKPSE
jgi:hypothetical protein